MTVEAYTDTDFTDPATAPEPGTWALLSCGMVFLASAGCAVRTAEPRSRRYAGPFAVVVSVSLCGSSLFAQDPIDPNVANQIGALLQEKANRTGGQEKLDSQLWYALQASRGQMVAGANDVYATAVDAVKASARLCERGYQRLVSAGLLTRSVRWVASSRFPPPSSNPSAPVSQWRRWKQ